MVQLGAGRLGPEVAETSGLQPPEDDVPGPSADVPDFESLARSYRLLSIERRFAKRYFAKHCFETRYLQASRRSRPMRSIGPDALILDAVTRMLGLPGVLLALAGLGLAIVSGDATYATWIFGIGVTAAVVGFLRGLSLNSTARRCQEERDRLSRLPPPPPR